MGRSLPLAEALMPRLPMGLARLFKKVIGIKGAGAAAAKLAGEREIEGSAGRGEGRAGRESRGDTCAWELGGKAAARLWEDKIK